MNVDCWVKVCVWMWRVGAVVAAAMDGDANEADLGMVSVDERKCFARQEKCDTERQSSCGHRVVFSGSWDGHKTE